MLFVKIVLIILFMVYIGHCFGIITFRSGLITDRKKYAHPRIKSNLLLADSVILARAIIGMIGAIVGLLVIYRHLSVGDDTVTLAGDIIYRYIGVALIVFSIIATIAVTFISNYLNKQILILSGLPILEDDTSFINDCINLQRSHREIILGQFLYIISNILLEVALIL